MKRAGILILINIIVLSGFCALTIFTWISATSSYNALERNELNSTLESLNSELSHQDKQIRILAKDYACWDDAYHYFQGTYPDYVTDNFEPIYLNNLNIQLVVCIDPLGKILNQSRINQDIPLLPPQIGGTDLAPLLMVRSENESSSAIITINQTTFLISGVPVLHNNLTGPVAGTLLFGKKIDDSFPFALKNTVYHPVSSVMQGSALFRNTGGYTEIPRFPFFKAEITGEDPDNIESSFSTLTTDAQTVLTFSVKRPKIIEIKGKEILGDSLKFLIIFAVIYSVLMTVIILKAFSWYDKTRDELEMRNQEIRMLAERKRLSDNIERILNAFLRFKPDPGENIRMLVTLASDILGRNHVIYSKTVDGTDAVVASPGRREGTDNETGIMIPRDGVSSVRSCPVYAGSNITGNLSVYFRDGDRVQDYEETILHLIASAIAVEENRGHVQIALQRRDQVLESVSRAATILMLQADAPDFHLLCRMLGEVLSVSRVYLSILPEKQEEFSRHCVYEPWISTGAPVPSPSYIPFFSEWGIHYPSWNRRLTSEGYVAGSGNAFFGSERELLDASGIMSVAMFPIHKKNGIIGILVCEDMTRPRDWISPECNALMTAAVLVGVTLERVEIEEQNRNYTNQLSEKSLQLARMNNDIQERSDQIERLLARKNELINQIGHDIRTPLTPILSLIPYIRKEISNPDTLSLLDMMETGARRIKLLLDKILVLKQIPGEYRDQGDQGDISVLINQITDKFRDIIIEKKITVKNNVPPDLRARIPEDGMKTILKELTGNAIRFTLPEGTIIFDAITDQSSITVIITDNGIGMKTDELGNIFEAFYKVDPSRHSVDTHGLGLSIVKQIIEKYHGSIIAISEGPGSGTKVSFTLPAR